MLYKKIEGRMCCKCDYPCSCNSPRYIEASIKDIAHAYNLYVLAEIEKWKDINHSKAK